LLQRGGRRERSRKELPREKRMSTSHLVPIAKGRKRGGRSARKIHYFRGEAFAIKEEGNKVHVARVGKGKPHTQPKEQQRKKPKHTGSITPIGSKTFPGSELEISAGARTPRGGQRCKGGVKRRTAMFKPCTISKTHMEVSTEYGLDRKGVRKGGVCRRGLPK